MALSTHARESGGLVGFNEEMAREICRRAVVRCTLTNAIFADILPGIESGKFDLGFGNYLRTPEREKQVAFSDPIWRSSSRLVGTPEAIRRYTARAGRAPDLDNLRDVRIVTVQGTQQHLYLQSLAAERKLTVLPQKTMADAMTALSKGQADLAIFPILSAYALIQREAPGSFEFVGTATAEHGLGGNVHIALPKDNEALRQKVNQAIAALRADGTYPRIARRHFPFNLE
jgi:ABC-type amino acid transport substrate-binding protein